jgi:phage baseplate assembly protein W
MSINPFFKQIDNYVDIAYGPRLTNPLDPLDDITDPKDEVKQNFRILLLTKPGERLTDNNFGVGIQNYLFELANPQTYGQIKTRITTQVSIYMPYLTIQDMRVGLATPDSQSLRVIIKYYVPSLDQLDEMVLTFPT